MVASSLVLPFFFFAMIVLLMINRKNMKGNEIALVGMSLPLNIIFEVYSLALYTARF